MFQCIQEDNLGNNKIKTIWKYNRG